MLTAMNAAIATQGSVANAVTTAIAFSGDRFVSRCTAGTSVVFGIQVLSGSSAAESLGCVQNQAAGLFGAGGEEEEEGGGGDLDLVAANTVPTDSAGAAPTQDTGASDEEDGNAFGEEEDP